MSATATARLAESGFSREGHELIRRVATNVLQLAPALADSMALLLHEQLPDLGAVTDQRAISETRRSCADNVRELLIMFRAGIPATAHETPDAALEYARFLHAWGVGLATVVRAYQLGVSRFRPVVAAELTRSGADPALVSDVAAAAEVFVWRYIDRVLERLSEEFETKRDQRSSVDDPAWSDPAGVRAAQTFMDRTAETVAGRAPGRCRPGRRRAFVQPLSRGDPGRGGGSGAAQPARRRRNDHQVDARGRAGPRDHGAARCGRRRDREPCRRG
jgi:hypothetical protein